MLTIERFEKLKGRTFVLPNFWGYTIIEAKPYMSPVRNDWMYVVKLKPSHNNKEISFSLYRDINKKEDGYRLYNTITGDYSIIKLESFKNMRRFTDILKNEITKFNQVI